MIKVAPKDQIAVHSAEDQVATPAVPAKVRNTRGVAIRQADITRAIRGFLEAGIEIGRMEIEGGKLVIVAAGKTGDGGNDSEWDGVLPP